MKNRKCPIRKNCFGYKESGCGGCDIGEAITKLYRKIERLKKQNIVDAALLREKDACLAEWDAKCNTYEAKLIGKEREIERLTAQIEHCDACDRIGLTHSEHIFCIKQARAEAIDEFAERLKASLNFVSRWQMHGDKNEYFIIGKPFIDGIAKEMKEGEMTDERKQAQGKE